VATQENPCKKVPLVQEVQLSAVLSPKHVLQGDKQRSHVLVTLFA
jgi:hypothetical protein